MNGDKLKPEPSALKRSATTDCSSTIFQLGGDGGGDDDNKGKDEDEDEDEPAPVIGSSLTGEQLESYAASFTRASQSSLW